jgi:hypothetical protein
VASGSDDKTVKLWDASSGKLLAMRSFKTAASMILRRKAAGYGRNQTPKTGGRKGHSFGSCKRAELQGRNGLRYNPISHLVPLLEFNQGEVVQVNGMIHAKAFTTPG